MKNDTFIEEFLSDTNYYIGEDWKIYTNRPPSGPLGKKLYPWRNITRVNESGYEFFTYNRKFLMAHRSIFRFYYGFIQPLQINHKDGNKLNNHPLNLELVTCQQNIDHAVGLGLRAKGERVGTSVLTESQVHTIKDLLKRGFGVCEIARHLDVCYHIVSRIKNNKHWKHVI